MNPSEFTEWLKLIQSAQQIGVTTQEVREFLKEYGETVTGGVMREKGQEPICREDNKTGQEFKTASFYENDRHSLRWK